MTSAFSSRLHLLPLSLTETEQGSGSRRPLPDVRPWIDLPCCVIDIFREEPCCKLNCLRHANEKRDMSHGVAASTAKQAVCK